MGKRLPQELKEKGLELFLKGKMLEEIASILKVKFESVKTWHKIYKWAEKKAETSRKVAEKTIQKVAEKDAKYRINIRDAFLNEYYNLQTIESESEKAFEKTAAVNAKLKALFHVAKIDGLIIDKSKNEHQGDINHKVIPIFGDVKLNVHSNNSNEKTTNSG